MSRTKSDKLAVSRFRPQVSIVLRMLYEVGEASNVGPLKGVAGVGSLVMEQCMVSILQLSS